MAGFVVLGLLVAGLAASGLILWRAYINNYSQNHRERWDDEVREYLEEDNQNG